MESENEKNYLLLTNLLKTHGNDMLRGIFRTRYLVLTSSRWQDGSSIAKEFLNPLVSSGKFTSADCEMMKTADIQNFGLELLTKLIPQMDGGQFKAPRFAMVQNQLCSENHYIEKLEHLRKKVHELPGKTDGAEQFEKLWDGLEEVLIKLGVPREYFDNLLTISPGKSEQKKEGEGEQEAKNYRRLSGLFEVGTERLRVIFGTRYLGIKGQYWRDGSKEAKDYLLTLIQTNTINILPMQRKMIDSADTDDFDFRLLATLIPKMDFAASYPLIQQEVDFETAKIQQLVTLRNKFVTLPGNTIDNERFKELWGKVRRVLIKLDVDEDDIKDVLNDSGFNEIGFEKCSLTADN